MELHGKRSLVTGATGFIGGQLAKRLQIEEGVQVRALVRSLEKGRWLSDLGVELVEGDITDATSVRQAVQGCDLVYHAAAYVGEAGNEEAVWDVNVVGTHNVVDAAVSAKVQRFVHLSSCAVYGSLQQMDIDETTAIRKTGRVYHDSKVEAEEVVFTAYRRQDLPAVSARISQVYGPGSPQLTLRVLEAVNRKKVILIDGGQHYFKPVYIDNLIDALVLCAQVDEAVGEAINISDGAPVLWRDFFDTFGRMTGVESFPSAPYHPAYVYAFFNELKAKVQGRTTSMNREVVKTFRSHNSFSNAKARKLLGWEPKVGFQQGMQETEKWLKEKGLLD